MIAMCVALENPLGTISRSGRSAAGSTSEIDLIAAVTVPANDEHHICEIGARVAKAAEGTIYRLYGRASSSDNWTQVDEVEIGDYGTYTANVAVSHKFKAGEQWKVTGQQSTAGRFAVRVGGMAKRTDVRDY